ncbi:FG-GAP repeat domain-containing protein [Nocardioides sp. GXZ039]|uniref:FG-GAP repeat domain-containing protein n=1 Tax=Nocardioides sp. GXZ039 TaxID=3136018 RepID=UPI0030F46452
MGRRRRVAVVAVAVGCAVAATTTGASAGWSVHDGGTVTDIRVPPGGGPTDVCVDEIHGLAGYASAIDPGSDPNDFPIDPSTLTPTAYEVYLGPPGVDLFVDETPPGFRVGYNDGGGVFHPAPRIAAFTSPPREAWDPIEIGTDFYVFTAASFSQALAGVAPGATVGLKPHPTSPFATIAEAKAVDCGDKGFLRRWERDDNFCNAAGARVLAGDVTGDRRADLVCNDRASGDLWVAAAGADGTYRTGLAKSRTALCRTSGERLLLADVSGDRRADLICQRKASVSVALARTSGKFAASSWSGRVPVCRGSRAALVTSDVNGDHRADLVCRSAKSGTTRVALATKRGRYPRVDWTGRVGLCGKGTLLAGDLNGDGRGDLLCHTSTGKNAVVLAGRDGGFDGRVRSGTLTGCAAGAAVSLADVDKNRRADLICHYPADGSVRVALARSGGKLPKIGFIRNLGFCYGAGATLRVGDATGDRRADLLCRTSGTGYVSAAYSDL